MEDKDLQELFNAMQPSGVFNSVGELQTYLNEGNDITEFWPEVETAVTDPQNDYYEFFKDSTEFADYATGLVKKKDDGQLDSALVPTSAEPMSVPIIGNITSEEEPESQEEPFFTGDFAWLDNTFIGDAIGDVAQQMQSGQAAGQSSSEALDLLLAGSNVSNEDLEEFISQYGLSQSYGTSDEMLEFQQDAQDLGGGFAGTMLAGVKNPMAAVHMMASSMSQLANTKAATTALTNVGIMGATAGPLGLGISIPIAMGAAGGITETGMVFQELLIKELEAKGLDFNKENLRNILTDEEWFANARMTAIKKGGTTALIDMVGGTLTAGIGSSVTRGGRGAYKAAQELIEKGADVVDVIPKTATSGLRRAKGAAAVVGGDAVTGAASEAGGQLVAYGEMRGGEIAEEIFVGMGRTPTTFLAASLRGAKYKVNGKKVSRSELTEIMHGMNMYEISDAINDGQIEIKNDQGLIDLIYGDEKTKIPFEQAIKEQSKASKAYDRAKKKYDKAVKSGDQAAIDEAEAERVTAFEALDNAADIVAVESKKIADSRNRKPPRTGVREEDDVPTPEEPTPPVKPEEPEVLTEAEQNLTEAKAKLEEQENLESASAERRQKALEESGRADEAANLQERINNLQAKIDRGLTKKGKPFTKKGKEGLQKQIDNRTAELKALYADVKIEEDVANVLETSRSRAKAQAEVDRLQAEVDKEKSAKQADRTKTKEEKSLEDKLNRYGLRDNPNKPAKQHVINGSRLDIDNPDKSTFYKGFQVGSLLNHPVILQGFGRMGKKAFKGELRGFLRLRENGEVNFVTHNGRKTYVLGDLNKGFDIDALSTDYFVAMDNSPIPSITEGGQVVVNGKAYRLAKEKQFFGIERYKNNNIKSMIVIDEDGKEMMLIDNGRFQSNKKPATAFSAEMAQWAEQQQKRRKGELDSPEIVREEADDAADDAAPPEGPPEDTAPDADAPAPDPKTPQDKASRKEKLYEEGVFVPSESFLGRYVSDPLDKLRRRTLSERGFFPVSTQQSRDFRNGRLNLHVKRAEKTAKDLKKAFKRAGRFMDEDQRKAAQEAMGKIFTGQEMSTSDLDAVGVDRDLRMTVKRMRKHIDQISQDLLDSGLVHDKNYVDPDTGEKFNPFKNITENLGSYVTRSYELYDGKNWKNRVSGEAKNKAIKYFKDRILDEDIEKNTTKNQYSTWYKAQLEKNPALKEEDALQEYAAGLVEKILSQESGVEGVRTGPNDAPNTSPLRRRKEDMDPRLRALLGERTDIAANYAITVAKVATMVEKAKFLQDVRDQGLQQGWLFKGVADAGVRGFNTPIKIEGMPSEMNPLNGYVTTPEIAKAFLEVEPLLTRAQGSEFGAAIARIQGIAKWNKTVGSLQTHGRNIVGNLHFVAANGHLDARKAAPTTKILVDGLFKDGNKGYNRILELGIIDQGANLSEIKELMSKGTALDAMERRYKGSGSSMYTTLMKGKFSPVRFFNEAYQVEDDVFKIYGFEIEKSSYAKALYGQPFDSLSAEQKIAVEEKAAGIIKNVYPNYSRIGPLVKGISKAPAVGTFLAFQAESFRCAFNIGYQAYREMSDPATRAIGARRLAGLTTYLSGKAFINGQIGAAAGYGISGMLGMGREKDEVEQRKNDFDDFAPFLPPWAKAGYSFGNLSIGKGDVAGHVIRVTDIDRENGIVKYVDLSSTDSFSAQQQVFNRLLAGLEGRGGTISDNDIVDGVGGALIELVGPFVEEDMTASLTRQLINNARDGSGTQIYDPKAPVEEQLEDVFDWFYRLAPSTFDQFDKLKIDNAIDGYGETDLEKIQAMMGFREIEVDIAKQFNYGQLTEYKKYFQTANKMKFQAVDRGGSEQAIRDETEREKMLYAELAGYVESALNLGADDTRLYNDTKKRLQQVGITRKLYIDGAESDVTALDLIFQNNLDEISRITPSYAADYRVDDEGNYIEP